MKLFRRLTLRKRLKKEINFLTKIVITKQSQKQLLYKHHPPGRERIEKCVKLDNDIGHIRDTLKTLNSLL